MNIVIAVIFAMRDEAKPLIDALKLKKAKAFDRHFPAEIYLSDDKKILVSICGTDPFFKVDCIGTQAAAIVTTLIIREYNPDLIISAGTAGAFKSKGAAIGEVYLSRKIAFHDRRINLPGFDIYGMCITETPESEPIAKKLGFKLGNITSGNSLDMPEHDLKTIQAWGGEIKEMEAASIAWVSNIYHKKMIAVKSVTDLMDAGKPTEEEFLENLHMASGKLKEALMKILDSRSDRE
jgi:5'-methylthioadenosine nucleosidase